MFEKMFKLSDNHTTVRTEVMAGITTFMTMAYILAVNPSILGSTGMDTTAVLLATALASFLGTVCMAFMANLPFALSAGMGLNAFMAYTVVAGYGYSWQVALLALIGLFITAVLYIHRVNGAILFGILLTWIIGMLCELSGLYVPDAEAGFYTLFPAFGMTDFSKPSASASTSISARSASSTSSWSSSRSCSSISLIRSAR